MPQKRDETGTERAIRLRENKRNHRQRQKEYINDLESRLAEGQKRGVRATQEVQTAAQRVVLENKALRELLHHHGIQDNAINKWLSGQRDAQRDTAYLSPDSVSTSTNPVLIEPLQNIAFVPVAMEQGRSYHDGNLSIACDTSDRTSLCRQNTWNTSPSAMETSIKALPIPEQGQPNSDSLAQSYLLPLDLIVDGSSQSPLQKSCKNTCKVQAQSNSSASPPPCKLMTRLKHDPSVDMRKVDATATANDGEVPADGVECSKAYKMLVSYANTDEKLDAIARVLEEGCIGNKEGGCRVKNTTIFKALDEIGV